MITPESFLNSVIERNGRLGQDACRILAAAIQAVDPYQCVIEKLHLDGNELIIDNDRCSVEQINRIFVIGFGKAAVPMAKAVLDRLQDKVDFARVIVKAPEFVNEVGYKNKLEVLIGGHPVPDENSIQATRSLIADLPQFTPRDLVIVLISGGGSALFTSPLGDISLDDLQLMTSLLLRSGADIQEINTLRKHVDGVKGGRLAALLSPARIHTLILSDVIGDRLDMIASGPTVADPTTFADAWEIIRKYDLTDEMPQTILLLIRDGMEKRLPETLKGSDLEGFHLHNHLVGTNRTASEAAYEEAKRLGYNSMVRSNTLTGLTLDVAKALDADLREMKTVDKPYCLIYGGETTVKVVGGGLGGRNQDLALHMVPKIRDQKELLFISFATDGEDGPTDAAGAASDAIVFSVGTKMSLDVTTYIDTNNAYNYFNKMGALIKTGSTGTNVNDLILILAGANN
ncbi:MAG TPA: glycerate kinase [Anaerolineaceae bacterium]|nr:glycerate kinase [Anaerolineaceae bacterium]